MKNVAVVIPTYNERENIRMLVENILELDLGAQVIVVDDNSPDGTGELVDELAGRNESVQVIHRWVAGVGYEPEADIIGQIEDNHVQGPLIDLLARDNDYLTVEFPFYHLLHFIAVVPVVMLGDT